ISKFDNANKSFSNEQTGIIDIKTWATFKLDVLFDLKKGKRLTKANMIDGEIPFIGAIDNNNGYRQFIGQKPIHTGNTITVNYNGSVAEAFYQPAPFWASDDVNVLYPKFEMNQYHALFIIAIIKLEKYRFNYGRKWHLERMNNSEIKLPVNNEKEPDFEFMENYIKTLNYSKQI
ncbi:MAG: S-CspCI protein, partial [Candidatus Cloacimonetes bacterium]|nr:S-CspCI protein [Candidatus Cloacimonadota bacterium]